MTFQCYLNIIQELLPNVRLVGFRFTYGNYMNFMQNRLFHINHFFCLDIVNARSFIRKQHVLVLYHFTANFRQMPKFSQYHSVFLLGVHLLFPAFAAPSTRSPFRGSWPFNLTVTTHPFIQLQGSVKRLLLDDYRIIAVACVTMNDDIGYGTPLPKWPDLLSIQFTIKYRLNFNNRIKKSTKLLDSSERSLLLPQRCYACSVKRDPCHALRKMFHALPPICALNFRTS